MNELFTQPNSSNNQINWNHYKIIAAIYFTQLFHNNNDFSSTTTAIDLSDNLIKKLKKSIGDDINNAKYNLQNNNHTEDINNLQNNNHTEDINQINFDQYQLSPNEISIISNMIQIISNIDDLNKKLTKINPNINSSNIISDHINQQIISQTNILDDYIKKYTYLFHIIRDILKSNQNLTK